MERCNVLGTFVLQLRWIALIDRILRLLEMRGGAMCLTEHIQFYLFFTLKNLVWRLHFKVFNLSERVDTFIKKNAVPFEFDTNLKKVFSRIISCDKYCATFVQYHRGLLLLVCSPGLKIFAKPPPLFSYLLRGGTYSTFKRILFELPLINYQMVFVSS